MQRKSISVSIAQISVCDVFMSQELMHACTTRIFNISLPGSVVSCGNGWFPSREKELHVFIATAARGNLGAEEEKYVRGLIQLLRIASR